MVEHAMVFHKKNKIYNMGKKFSSQEVYEADVFRDSAINPEK